ncbi:MAG TPA: DUF4445 domain-containing protein [Candidatus Marinimicrobia bacterium]|nr:DUF4445 domain-containing protein [Candidatus Neomarinimicrobiota bacterium]
MDDDFYMLTEDELACGWRLGCKHQPHLGEMIQTQKLNALTDSIQENRNKNDLIFKKQKNYHRKISGKGFGIAVDLGTTTIAAELWQINPPQRLQSHTVYNSQRKYGDDLISRLAFAEKSALNMEKLTDLLLQDLAALFNKLLKNQNLSPDTIESVTISANTVMNHFLCGINPISLAYPPYEPPQIQPIFPFGHSLLPQAKFFIFPNLYGYLGGDTVSNLLTLHTLFTPLPKNWLLIDLGTNCEIVLANKGIYHLASAAA